MTYKAEYAETPFPFVAPNCVGLLGRWFGHKFVKRGWSSNGNCFRCGLPEGSVVRRA